MRRMKKSTLQNKVYRRLCGPHSGAPTMTRDTQTLQDDIAYMRDLAREGRNAPLLAGPVLVLAAVVFGAASLAQWAIQSGLAQFSPWASLWF
jgi:hypothetical protein